MCPRTGDTFSCDTKKILHFFALFKIRIGFIEDPDPDPSCDPVREIFFNFFTGYKFMTLLLKKPFLIIPYQKVIDVSLRKHLH